MLGADVLPFIADGKEPARHVGQKGHIFVPVLVRSDPLGVLLLDELRAVTRNRGHQGNLQSF